MAHAIVVVPTGSTQPKLASEYAHALAVTTGAPGGGSATPIVRVMLAESSPSFCATKLTVEVPFASESVMLQSPLPSAVALPVASPDAVIVASAVAVPANVTDVVAKVVSSAGDASVSSGGVGAGAAGADGAGAAATGAFALGQLITQAPPPPKPGW